MAQNPNALRIISGKYRGRSLKSPRSALTHPMGAREKLALFNMVNVEYAIVLDAYAGSGALGCEALSRGANIVDFVESSHSAAQVIQENLDLLNAHGTIYCQKVKNFAASPDHSAQYDVIFADPPYDKIDLAELNQLAACLRPGGTFALSSPKELGELVINGLRLVSRHIYARAQISIYKK